jgi:hypothetical protein
MSGLFGRGQGVTDPVTHAVYIVSGNGNWNGRTNWGDSVLKLDPAGSHLLDSYTPGNQRALDITDADLGSTGPALLPAVRQGNRTYHLLVQGGKGPACNACSGTALHLLDRDDLSGQGGPGHLGGDLYTTQAPGGCAVLTAPAVWKAPNHRSWVFYANECGVAGYRLSSPSRGRFHLDRAWFVEQGGTTPVLGGGVLYVARDGEIRAYHPITHALLGRTGGIASVHWQYPLIAGNRLFMTDESGHVFAYLIRRQQASS